MSDEEGEICPLSQASMLLSSKWDLIVIYNLLEAPLHFNELKDLITASIEKEMTSTTLSRITKKLETDEIIERHVKTPKGKPVEILYKLTPKGREIKPVIDELYKWSQNWLTH